MFHDQAESVLTSGGGGSRSICGKYGPERVTVAKVETKAEWIQVEKAGKLFLLT